RLYGSIYKHAASHGLTPDHHEYMRRFEFDRILLLEDQEDNPQILRDLLTSAGFGMKVKMGKRV
ncbi:MAG TPA: hypothetical protein VIK79_13635, partial [Xanthobacteraceae bacterium]